ncbi:RIMS-binding protein 3-like [Trichosurus vulpecula]|uniref:RIMS-binding protein 3-like n=1 Tax=Trichosurus vulpecula TaxID=9337 RepID=UPI00186B55B8|nr:RIMS-binding protein 3-like [Trichosurus vulpecula]
MTKDTPSPTGGGGRYSPKKPPAGPSSAMLLEEQRRELEAVRAELEAERARSQAERRRFATEARELREAGERERQQLADQLRSRWEMQRVRELRQLQEAVLRERDAEIRQLLRWKEAELRQLQQLLHKERDCAVRQARELQRQLAEELLSRGYCGRPGSTAGGGAAECRCKLQDVLAKLRWESDGEQAARIRHLQAALDVERSLFLKYILENFHWDPASVLSARPPRPNLARPEPAAAATAVVAVHFQAAGAGELPTAGAGELPAPAVAAAASTITTATTATTTIAANPASAPVLTPLGPAPPAAPVYRPRPVTSATRPRSLDSLCAPRPRSYSLSLDDTVPAARSSRSLDGSPSRAESPGAGEPEAGSPLDRSSHYPAVLPRLQLVPDNLGTGEKVPCEALRPSPDDHQQDCGRPPRAWGSRPHREVLSLQPPGKEGEVPLALGPRQPASAAPPHEAVPGLDYNDLVKQNSELAEALETLAKHCSQLREENSQLRRGFPETNEKVRSIKVKNAKLAVIAKRLEERARKLQETNLRAVSARVPGESCAVLELCRQAFARQRAKDLTEQTSAMLAKDKEIEDLRQECRDLQAQVAACQGPAQWLNVNDFDHLLRESQKEVLRLQRQVTLQSFKGPHNQRAASPPTSGQLQNAGKEEASEAEELKLQVQALEQTLSERQKRFESLELDVGKAQQRFQEAEGRLQQVMSENNWLAQENSRLQEKAQWLDRVDSENCEMRGKLELVTEERDSAALLTAQLQQQASRIEASRQQLEQELQEALRALAAQQGEAQRMQQDQEQMQKEHMEALQTLEAQLRELEVPCTHQAQELKPPQLLRGKQAKKATCHLEGASLPGSRTLAKKVSTRASTSDDGPGQRSFHSYPAPRVSTGSNMEEIEADSLSQAPEPEGPRSHHSQDSQDRHHSYHVHNSQDSHDSHVPSKLKIFLARYDYDPFAGPNDQPEAELPLTAGEYIYIFGDMDEDGFYAGELMDGQRGLVPSNLVEQISDSEILNLQPPEGSDSSLDSSQEVKSQSDSSSPEGKGTDSLEEGSRCGLLPKKLEKGIMEEALDFSGVPCPPKLTLIQQLPQGVVVDWEAPIAPNPYGAMQGYNVYVDNELWENISAGSQTRATIDNLDLKTRAYRISVQSVMERGCSNRLQCSFLVGGGFCPAPSQLRLRSLTSTSAEISWLDSGSDHPNMVYLNEEEHSLTKAGICCYTFHNLQPSTRYCARVEARPPGETTKKLWEEMSPSITFTTPSAGPPDPPLDVLVEYHTSPGTLLISWIPVTIDSAGSSNGVPVTGYAVYAGGQKVTEVTSPTAGNVLVEFSQLQQQKPSQEVSVRTMSHYGESLDSVPAQIPGEWLKRSSAYRSPPSFPVIHNCGELLHPQTPSTLRPYVPVSQEKSIMGSFSTKTSTPLPASCGRDKVVAADGFPEDSFQRRVAKPSEGELPIPGDINAPQGRGEAYFLSPLPSGRKESHGPNTAKDSRFGNPRHLCDGQIRVEEKSARNTVTRWPQVQELLHIPPENSPMREIYGENNSDGKVPRNRLEAEMLKVTSQSLEAFADHSHMADLANLEEEDQYVNMWGTRRPSQKKEFRLQKGQSRLTGLKKAAPLPEPSALLYQPLSGKMTKILKASPLVPAPGPWFRAPGSSPLKGNVTNDPFRVFVALWDYDPQLMSTNPMAAEEELAFQRGQLLKVWGDQDPDGFYHGECSGRVGYIPGDMVSELQVEGSDVLKQLLRQGHLPPGVSLDGLLGLSTQSPNPQKSFSMASGAPPHAQLWYPQTMVAAFDYCPQKSSSLSVTEELTLSVGDVVTVLGSVDDNGFFYGELNGQRGLVPSNLLKTPALNAE